MPLMKCDYLLVLDFEATCGPSVPKQDQEIIEFPIVVVDVKRRTCIAEFQSYVRPSVHPDLDEFCTELTGITQPMVQDAPTLAEVLPRATDFCRPYLPKAAFVTCGGWDLATMLPSQAEREALFVDPMFLHWINIKEMFSEQYGIGRHKGMAGMLAQLNMELLGRHHSGIDDSRNIAALAIRLINDDAKFTIWKDPIRK